MEYLVEMTTRVPPRTARALVDDVNARDAGRLRELVAEGTIMRLWRPVAADAETEGNERKFGLFMADEHGLLDKALASMPLHMWRTYEITPLSWHPDDPGSERDRKAAEFLTKTTITVPPGTSGRTIDELKVREAIRAHALAQAGHLLRLWTPPIQHGLWRTVGLWSAGDLRELHTILASLPLQIWTATEIIPLTD